MTNNLDFTASDYRRLAEIALRCGDGHAARQFRDAAETGHIGPDMGPWLHWDRTDGAPTPIASLGSFRAAEEMKAEAWS